MKIEKRRPDVLESIVAGVPVSVSFPPRPGGRGGLPFTVDRRSSYLFQADSCRPRPFPLRVPQNPIELLAFSLKGFLEFFEFDLKCLRKWKMRLGVRERQSVWSQG